MFGKIDECLMREWALNTINFSGPVLALNISGTVLLNSYNLKTENNAFLICILGTWTLPALMTFREHHALRLELPQSLSEGPHDVTISCVTRIGRAGVRALVQL